jgi:SagB-type dehydrogenase family enzyme
MRVLTSLAALLFLLLLPGCPPREPEIAARPVAGPDRVVLPPPETRGGMALFDALTARGSARAYRREGLTLAQVGQLLWAAAGPADAVTGATRHAPSAGATHPLELYVVVGEGELEAGVYRYHREDHALIRVNSGDLRPQLAAAALDQEWVRSAPLTVVVTAVFARTTARYGERGVRYVYMEAGHLAQNLCLAAEALGLGTVVVGAFHDRQVAEVLGIGEEVLLLLPIGRVR